MVPLSPLVVLTVALVLLLLQLLWLSLRGRNHLMLGILMGKAKDKIEINILINTSHQILIFDNNRPTLIPHGHVQIINQVIILQPNTNQPIFFLLATCKSVQWHHFWAPNWPTWPIPPTLFPFNPWQPSSTLSNLSTNGSGLLGPRP